MPKGNFYVPEAYNEPVKSYAPGSPERESLQKKYDELWNTVTPVHQVIAGERVEGTKKELFSPHDHQHCIAHYYEGTGDDVKKAIDSALAAKAKWAALPWEERAAIFLKAAELVATKYRDTLNAATMIGQSKTAFQAEIDSACELTDFLRFNVQYMTDIYAEQPSSSEGIWNRVEYRPVEGFLYAVTPFNFTAIAGNLPSCMALMGNVVVWKPAHTQLLAAKFLMDVFEEAGLPKGVINLVITDAKETTKICFEHPDFAGVHFTGSTAVFQSFWTAIGNNIQKYKTYPRIVGETGGKDFVLAHPSADKKALITALSRGAFEFQGQKCSAASRAYIPACIYEEVIDGVKADLASFKMGTPRDFSNFITAVIDRKAFDRITKYIEQAKSDADAEIVAGGNYDDSKGYFIEPTIIKTTNPHYVSMEEEIFGPVLTIYVYEDKDWAETLKLVDGTSGYALTGAIFAQDRYAITEATKALENAAGNFYVNDKPTGAVVGQQPFGGARLSGTNDKAGSAQNLLRWVSPRLIKETFVPPTDYRYPFLAED
ncbi:L-glutamate gamma-semialdehyde dehydrogenase [Ornithobacterium rhinotracheale]|uniref:L-glutamate gamma-semialdehyde dehydrogenase n=1 Tax=Ornithobacterium rhinotracheale TaxID=28251 RepID=UPI001FF22E99|nr:L-glutamate gamma-semialdehyde dehydrogenase [Ornithobacterium rhinotracheale]MCK0200173.1 L-glutamate gamma-semialdehyde dehydrogenase [Ornithobacterium rhinotracheale]